MDMRERERERRTALAKDKTRTNTRMMYSMSLTPSHLNITNSKASRSPTLRALARDKRPTNVNHVANVTNTQSFEYLQLLGIYISLLKH